MVGVFVLAVIGLLAAGIFLAGRSQGWFEPVQVVRIELPEEGSFGLRPGAEVQVLQTPVGVVDQIVVRDDGAMEAVLEIRGAFARFVRQDSVAMLRKKFAVAGDAYVAITRGTGEPLPKEGAYIEAKADEDLIEQVQTTVREFRSQTLSTVEDLRSETLSTLEKFQTLLDEHAQLAARLRDPEGDLQEFLAGLNAVTEGLAQGEGTMGKLLRDPALAEEMEELLVSLNTAVEQVGSVLDSLEETATQFPDVAETLDDKLKDVPDLILQAQITLHEFEKLLKAFQRHWLVRGAVREEEATGRVPVERIDAPR